MNHCAKYAKVTVDLAHSTSSPRRTNRSATSSAGGRLVISCGGRWRASYVRSVSDDHDVYGVSVLSGLGRGGTLFTAELISSRLT